jgi:hypothetical protein
MMSFYPNYKHCVVVHFVLSRWFINWNFQLDFSEISEDIFKDFLIACIPVDIVPGTTSVVSFTQSSHSLFAKTYQDNSNDDNEDDNSAVQEDEE